MKKRWMLPLAVIAAAFVLSAALPAGAPLGPVTAEAATLYQYTVRVDSGYLALRNAQAYDSRNEIGKLYTGETVQVYDYNMTSSDYWWVYAPSLGKSGYVNNDYLTGGKVIPDGGSYVGATMTVKVSDGYLALRTAKAFDYNNEIGSLYSGDTVVVIETSDPTYWWVYSGKLNKFGYVNRNYLVGDPTGGGTVDSDIYVVRVDSGYLALRNDKAYDSSNEIGKMYTGETVEVIDYLDGQYWYVYSPKLDRYGYTNKDYLMPTGGHGTPTPSPSYTTWTVKVSDGYLALRNAQAYDSSNEIGKLYTGDTVQVSSDDMTGGQYWWVYAPSLGKYGYVNNDYIY